MDNNVSRSIAFFGSSALRTSRTLFLATMVLVALPLGSNRDWAWGLLAVIVALLVIVRGLGAHNRDHVPLAKLILPGIVFAVAMGWSAAAAFLEIAPGAANPIVNSAYSVLGLQSHGRIALSSDAPITGVMLWLTYGLTFLLAVDIARDFRDAKRLCVALVVAGFVCTLYGFASYAAYLSGGDLAAIFPKFGNGISLSGTFPNRDNYATFSGLCALCALALIRMDGPSSAEQVPFKARLRRMLRGLGGSSGIYSAVLIVLVVGLMLSGSRAGTFSFVCAIITGAMLARRPSLVTMLGIVALCIVLLILPGGLRLVAGFGSLLEQGAGERRELHDLVMQAIEFRPWTGWGLGSFPALYSLLQPSTLNLSFDKAHNTYLELVTDLGIPFGLILPAIIFWLVGRCAIGLRERAHRKEMPLLAISAAVLVGVHSIFDFSLQIPAVAVVFAAILGIGWAQSWSTRRIAGAA